MFLKIVSSKKNHDLIGYFCIKTENSASSKAIRCLSITMASVNSILNRAIIEKRTNLTVKDLEQLVFKKLPKTRSILPVLKVGQDDNGWISSLDVLLHMEHELLQLIAYLDNLLSELIASFKDNKELLGLEIKQDLDIVMFYISELKDQNPLLVKELKKNILGK